MEEMKKGEGERENAIFVLGDSKAGLPNIFLPLEKLNNEKMTK